jgi:hypothetical protein
MKKWKAVVWIDDPENSIVLENLFTVVMAQYIANQIVDRYFSDEKKGKLLSSELDNLIREYLEEAAEAAFDWIVRDSLKADSVRLITGFYENGRELLEEVSMNELKAAVKRFLGRYGVKVTAGGTGRVARVLLGEE